MDTQWLNRELYPFHSKFIQLPAGRMHYVDEGQGDVLLFVHGTPAWSFVWRHQIKALASSYRCIAVDHLGFGLSDKPANFEGTPEAHAAQLTHFAEALRLTNITLVVHDFGGPIGLGMALNSPDRISRLVVLNTWLWKTADNPAVQKVNRLLSGPIGRFLYLHLNFSPLVLMKQAFYDKTKLPREVHRHYIRVFPDKTSRLGLLRIGQSLFGSSSWFETQHQQLPALAGKPSMIIWGLKDAFIKPDFLEKWKQLLPTASVYTLEAGHFVQEENPGEVTEAITAFVSAAAKQSVEITGR